MKNIKLAHLGFPRHSAFEQAARKVCREGRSLWEEQGLSMPYCKSPAKEPKRGREAKNLCEEEGGKGGDGDPKNKVLLLSYSLRLRIKDQRPLIFQKLFGIPFYPWLLRTQSLCKTHMLEQIQLHRQQDISHLITKKSTCCLEALCRMAAGVFTLYFWILQHSDWGKWAVPPCK